MNKKLFLLVTFLLSLGLGFTACGDDDKDGATDDYAAEVAGTYNGLLVVTVEDIPNDVEGQDIKLERTGENKVKLSLDDFSFGDMEIGSIVIETSVTENNGTVKLADVTKELTLGDGLKCKVALSSAKVKDKELTLNITVSDISIPGLTLSYTVDVDFTGDKK